MYYNETMRLNHGTDNVTIYGQLKTFDFMKPARTNSFSNVFSVSSFSKFNTKPIIKICIDHEKNSHY